MCPIASASARCAASVWPLVPSVPSGPTWCWALDFQFDQTSDGRMLKLLNVIDEYTREALAIDVERSIDADGVVACLDAWPPNAGLPVYVRFDHGPEFIAYAVSDRCRFSGTDTVFIDPGSPWQNAWIESLQRPPTRRALERSALRLPARGPGPPRGLAHGDYNINRPHSAHGWLTPVEFVEAWLHRQQLTLA